MKRENSHEFKKPFRVRGKTVQWEEIDSGGELYHGSPHKLPVGTILTGQPEEFRNYKKSPNAVSLTSDPEKAGQWGLGIGPTSNKRHDRAYVYLVEPLAEVSVWRAMPANFGKSYTVLEARTSKAKIIGVERVFRLKRGLQYPR